MKVLQVNCVYKKGSTGKITYELHRGLLNAGIESVVCYGRGELVRDPYVYKTCPEWYSMLNNALSRINGIMYGGCNFSTNRLISIIKNEKPDIVHLQCINGFFVNIYRLIDWLKANRIRTVLTLHAEFMYTGGCGHSIDCNQWSTREGCGHSIKCPRYRSDMKSLFDRTPTMWGKMREAFEGFDDRLIVTSVSPWLMERAERSPILGGKRHCVVLNGVDTAIFHPYENGMELRKELGIDETSQIIFHATARFNSNPNHIKGGYYIIELAKWLPEIQFVVAGSYSDSLHVPKNILLLGQVKDQVRLAQLYSMSNLTVLTSKKETFSMVTAESLCCGTPIVGFKAGAPEQIAVPEYSAFVEYGDMDGLLYEIERFLSVDKFTNISYTARNKYANSRVVQGYLDCYSKLM